MLTKRIIPCLDVKCGRVVKGVNFVELRDAGDPVELASAYDREGADEVVFLDITATSDNRATTIDMAAHAAEELSIPYTVGGGFRDLAGMRQMVAAGADKVSLNSAAVRDPNLITQAAAAFGKSLPRAAATLRVSTPLNGLRRRHAAARARSCLRAWIETAPKRDLTWRSRAPWPVRFPFL